MRFDAFIFPLFFAIVLAAYWGLRSRRAQNVLILIASYVFYGWWDWRFLLLIGASTVVDFTVAKGIAAAQDRGDSPAAAARAKHLMWVSVAVNLGILGLFKYFDFFVGSVAAGLGAMGLEANLPLLHIILPVGISFYTFQTLGYTIDVYRRDQPAERDWVAFACYVAFFPQLVAGPIERASRLVPQFSVDRTLDVDRFRSGVTLIVFGLVKKVAIADNMAPLSDYVFGISDPGSVSAPLILAGTIAFAFQIYADFSGYSDIARGTARLMGFELCVNFDKPYVAVSPSDFWRRWHISLSGWLRDYLYIPLGGNRGGPWFTYRNLAATMVLGGLWHGAAWNFVAWGAWHGFILCVYRIAKIDAYLARAKPWTRMIAVPVFWVLTLYGWLLFRAGSAAQVGAFTSGLFGAWTDWQLALPILQVVGWFALPIVVHQVLSRGLGGEKWVPSNPWIWRASIAGVAVYGLMNARASETAFLYFQF